MSDHHFSPLVCEAFKEIGEYDFSNLVEHQSWSARSRVIAKQRIYEKYILPEDVFKASWLQQSTRNTPGANHTNLYYWGQKYIFETLALRSNGLWKDEMKILMDNLPTAFDYAMASIVMTEPEPEKPFLKIVK